MDGWERTKLAAALALAVGTAAGSAWLSGRIMAHGYPQKRGYAIQGVAPVDLANAQRAWPRGEGAPGARAILLGYVREIDKAQVPAAAAAAQAPAAPVDLGTLLAGADPARGEKVAQVCKACHNFAAGGPNGVGPNLHGVVGRPVASHPGFAYSPALAGLGGSWTYDGLDRFLTSPQRAAAGTKMSFSGLRNPRDRAQIIAWLAQLSPGAPPFPKPAASPAPSGT